MSLRVFMPCTGLGRMLRGYESFTVECHAALSEVEGLDVRLFASGRLPGARRIPSVARHRAAARRLGSLLDGRDGYFAEQATFAAALLPYVLAERPDVLFVSDISLAGIFSRLRRRMGMGYRVVLSNGGLAGPPYGGSDHVQQLAPVHLARAVELGLPAERQTLLPYGIHPPGGPAMLPRAEQDALRRRLGLPVNRPVLLSVAALDRRQKRLDVLVEEVASLGPDRPFLVMLGHAEADAADIVRLATQRLGADGFTARSVEREAVADYHRAADAFVLSSLVEGLPRAMLEAAARGLPCVAHDSEVTRFVLAEHGTYAKPEPGALAAGIASVLARSRTCASRDRQAAAIAERFAWARLAPRYAEMLRAVAA